MEKLFCHIGKITNNYSGFTVKQKANRKTDIWDVSA